MNEVKLVPRETHCFDDVSLTGQHFGPFHIAVDRPSDGPQLWQVVSDEPTSIEAFTDYGERFQIEQGFLDDKSGLLNLEASKLRDASSLERLILVLSVATLMLVAEDMQTVQCGDRRVVDPHRHRALSYLKIGLRAVQYPLNRGQGVFSRLSLRGGPDPEPLSGRKRLRAEPQTIFEVG